MTAMEQPLGTYTTEIVFIRSHVGVWRFECKRCGLVVQTKEGESSERAHAAKHHVCDPFKKTGYRFDPSKPFTILEEMQEILNRAPKTVADATPATP